MKILFVSDVSISKVIGGAERVLFEQSSRLARRGHHVYVMTRLLPDHRSFEENIQGVHEWRYDVDRRSAFSFFRSSIVNSRALYELMRNDISFDIVNGHQPFSSLGVLKSRTSRNSRFLYTCLSLSFEEYRSRHPGPLGLIGRMRQGLHVQGRKYVEGKVLHASERIIALSTYTRDKLLSQYGILPGKIDIIPGGVDLECFHPSGDRRDIRRRLEIPENRTVLLTVRNLVPRMGLENLLTAMKDVVKALPDALLIIGGNGPLRDNLLRLTLDLQLGDSVRFDGFICDEDLPDYYRAADLFILPTVELEGFGLVTLEALACGTPVLGTPVGGTLEILQRLDNRYLFDGTGPDAMARRIIEVLRQYADNPDLRNTASWTCRSFVEQHYSWERNVDQLEGLFCRFSGGPRNGKSLFSGA